MARTIHFAMHSNGPQMTAVLPCANGYPAPTVATPGEASMGALIPKRLAKRAVTRNAIKRQIYIVGAQYKATLPVAAHVVRLRARFDSNQYFSATSDKLKSAVRWELEQLFASAAPPVPPTVQGS